MGSFALRRASATSLAIVSLVAACSSLEGLTVSTPGEDGGASGDADRGGDPAPLQDAGDCDAGLAACGAECVDLARTAKHCSTCGHDCLGGECLDGTCAPIVVATMNDVGGEIAADDTWVVWATTKKLFACHVSTGRTRRRTRSASAG